MNGRLALMAPCALILTSLCIAAGPPAGAAEPRAVTTFECVGLSWKTGAGAADRVCTVRYRPKGTEPWREGLPLWFDARNGEYRGSVVGLKPGAAYEIEVRVTGADATARITARTWPEQFPVAKTVTLKGGTQAEPLVITEGGRPDGYVLYEGAADEPTIIDVANRSDFCVDVRASFVIVRGLTLKNAKRDGIRIGKVHDVVVERCDISGWGRRGPSGYGLQDGGITCSGKQRSRRLIIQRNRIHDPRWNANAWDSKGEAKSSGGYHPYGPQGMMCIDTGGNHVIRYNEVTGDDDHCYNDGIGGGRNFSTLGFPGRDSDVYGNIVTHCKDDALEIEGGGCNVRVWGNHIDRTMSGIATATVAVGPLYVFRNVFARSRWTPYPDGNTDALFHYSARAAGGANRGFFSKVSQDKNDSGRQYWFHNTMLQPPPPKGRTVTLGARWGVHVVGAFRSPPATCGVYDYVSYNNIWHVAHTADRDSSDYHSIEVKNDSPTNTFDYDLYNGKIIGGYEGVEAHGIRGVPVYAEGHGPTAEGIGRYHLAPTSPGFDAGKRLPNFNDGFNGKAPDIGAHESGAPPMRFGVEARGQAEIAADARPPDEEEKAR